MQTLHKILQDRLLTSQSTLSSRELARLGRRVRAYEDLAMEWQEWQRLERSQQMAQELVQVEQGSDPELSQLAREEVRMIAKQLQDKEQVLRRLLQRPEEEEEEDEIGENDGVEGMKRIKDDRYGMETKSSLSSSTSEQNSSGAVLELRAGMGGEEAALFAGELLAAYEKYAALKGWTFGRVTMSMGGDGASTSGSTIREVIAHIDGENVFGRLRWESGVHRVQRVPRTEAQGRVHTSTVTVAILPQASQIRVQLDDRDLRFDSFKSSGPGGQHVNKTNSAVRVVHLPTGIAVTSQEERCAQQNKMRALRVLQARLQHSEQQKVQQARRSSRQAQIGSAERSEKIRTYNFAQDRITDHRLGLSLHDLDAFMAGRLFDPIIEQLIIQDEESRLARLLESLEDIS